MSELGPASADGLRNLVALSHRGAELDPATVAREFEALLATELLRAAAKPLAGTQPLGGSGAARIWRERFFEEAARRVADRGGFGIARMIERELASREPEGPR